MHLLACAFSWLMTCKGGFVNAWPASLVVRVGTNLSNPEIRSILGCSRVEGFSITVNERH